MQSWGSHREVEKPKTKTQQVADYQERARLIATKLDALLNMKEGDAMLLSTATVREAAACLRIVANARRLSL